MDYKMFCITMASLALKRKKKLEKYNTRTTRTQLEAIMNRDTPSDSKYGAPCTRTSLGHGVLLEDKAEGILLLGRDDWS